MEDVKVKDREELQRIMRGDFRRRGQDHMPEMEEMDDDDRDRVQRMGRMVDWMKRREEEDQGMYINEDLQDDEMDYYYDYNGTRKKVDKRINNTQQQHGD